MGLLLWEIKYRKMVYHEVFFFSFCILKQNKKNSVHKIDDLGQVRGMFANEEIKQKVLKGERPHLRDNDSYDQLIEAPFSFSS